MKCAKCGKLDPSLVMGECFSCIVTEQSDEIERLRVENASLHDRVRDLERENFRLRDRLGGNP